MRDWAVLASVTRRGRRRLRSSSHKTPLYEFQTWAQLVSPLHSLNVNIRASLTCGTRCYINSVQNESTSSQPNAEGTHSSLHVQAKDSLHWYELG